MSVLQDRDARREALLAAAAAVVQREGANASMAAIATEAGITKPILYRHFGDKSGLYAALAERHTERLLGALNAALGAAGTPRERVHRTVDAYLQAIEDEPQTYRFLVQSVEAAPVQGQVRGFVRRLQEHLGKGIALELGLPADDVRAAVWAAGIIGMVQGAGDWWLETRAIPRTDLSAQLTDLLWGAYGVAAGGPAARRLGQVRSPPNGVGHPAQEGLPSAARPRPRGTGTRRRFRALSPRRMRTKESPRHGHRLRHTPPLRGGRPR